MIKPAEWPAVSIIHRVPMPPEVRTLLDQTLKSVQAASAGANRGPSASLTTEKKPNHATGKMPTPTGSPRSSTISIPTLKSRPGGSPQMKPSSLVGTSRLLNVGMSSVDQPGSAPTSPPTSRRSASIDKPVKRIEGFRTTPPANTRKLSDLESTSQAQTLNQSQTHVPNSRNPQVAVTLTVPSCPGNAGDEITRPSLKRRASSTSPNVGSKESSSIRVTSTPKAKGSSTSSRSVASLARNVKAMSLISDDPSDSSSCSSGSSINDGSTVTSEGFTDYLSDESDVELQRQAEVRAAQLEQNRVEEEEFKAARQQLTSIDLRPPQTWDPRVAITSTPSRGYGRSR